MPYATRYDKEMKIALLRNAAKFEQTYAMLAQTCGVNLSTVHAWSKRYGIKLKGQRRDARTKLSLEDREKIAKDMRPASKVAAAYKVSVTMVYNMRKAFMVKHPHALTPKPEKVQKALAKVFKEKMGWHRAAKVCGVSVASMKKHLQTYKDAG